MDFDIIDLAYIANKKLPPKRMFHTVGVVRTAVKLAKIYGADVNIVTKAALMHDICKYSNIKYMQKICRKYYSNILSEEDMNNNEILHGFVAAYWVHQKLGIDDKEILNAIKYHTIGNKDMSLVSKIIYISDAIEPSRNYPSVDKLRELAFENINLAIVTEVEEKEKFLKTLGKISHKNTIEMRTTLLKELNGGV